MTVADTGRGSPEQRAYFDVRSACSAGLGTAVGGHLFVVRVPRWPDMAVQEEERQRKDKEEAEKASAAAGKRKTTKRKKGKKSKASKEEL